MEKLRIGVLGCAKIAKRSVIPAMLTIDGIELVAVSSRTEDKANEYAELFNCEAVVGYQNLLDREDIDVIYMPLPTGLHEEWVIKALQAGKHIHIEKSLAMDYDSATRMVDMARDKNLLIMENFMFLYHGQHQFVQELIDKGEIGELRCFRSSFGFPPLPEGNFRYNKELGGGALLDAAAYTVRASQLFLGNDLWVEAATLNNNGSEVDLYGGAYLKAENGSFAEVAFGFDNFYQCNYEIWGSTGKITAHRSFTPGADYKPVITVEKQGEVEEHVVAAENHFVNILKEFVNTVNSGQYETKYEEVLNQARILHGIRKKAETL